jgi:hypothetical protein
MVLNGTRLSGGRQGPGDLHGERAGGRGADRARAGSPGASERLMYNGLILSDVVIA